MAPKKYVLLSGSHTRMEPVLDSEGKVKKDSQGKVRTQLVRYEWNDEDHNIIELTRVQHASGNMQERVKLYQEFSEDEGEDPGDMTGTEVTQHVKDLDVEELEVLLAREERGQNRTGVTKTIRKALDDLDD